MNCTALNHTSVSKSATKSSTHPSANVIVAALNNTALALISQGKNEEAINLLGNALSAPAAGSLLSSSSILDDESMPTTMRSSAFSESDPIVFTRNADDPFSASPDLQLPDKEVEAASPSNFFTIYNRVIEIADISSLKWERYSNHIPAILLYNSGLAWHKIAFRENCDAKYERALENYSAAHSQLVYHASLGMYHPEVCDVLLLALCNNMGHIHSHFIHLKETRLCVEALFTVFFMIGNKRILSKEEYVFFYMNILLTVNRTPVLAPAA
ncbi:hypothetical protein FisN_3Hh149 [Fistulifera solaris]|jgi:hypothetical protein|uniref:CCR4-NOT transcription complex subunit 10 n=1 Tax=Fistulifera solaris TaxID=1519565 RepID=A0A1Z5JNR4_FISSO|nr:hypothetical protein FisN_3Hh149 [Fistulifera solaris]|eukprot:GAX15675.1 hypothetical protein FisN_3Hh149 [Fistulifera solaris]